MEGSRVHLNIEKHLILIRNQDKTSQVKSCTYSNNQWKIKFNGNNKPYTYNYQNVVWERNPTQVDSQTNIVYHKKQPITGIKKTLQFKTHVRLIVRNGYSKVHLHADITIEQTTLANQNERNTFDYLTDLAKNMNERLMNSPPS